MMYVTSMYLILCPPQIGSSSGKHWGYAINSLKPMPVTHHCLMSLFGYFGPFMQPGCCRCFTLRSASPENSCSLLTLRTVHIFFDLLNELLHLAVTE